MNTKRNWVQVAVVVAMAVVRLSFTTPVAADLCGVPFVSEFDQYMAATEWAEQGGPVPTALMVSCVEDNSSLTASLADLSADSGTSWEQYSAAIEGRELSLNAAPASSASRAAEAPLEMFQQYQAAVEEYSQLEFGWSAPSWPTFKAAEESMEMFLQFQAAVEEYTDQ